MDVALQLTTDSLAEGVAELSRRDPHLAAVVARHGAPPLWDRPPGFGTLVQIILEQQISLSAGRAAYGRLERLAGAVTPRRGAHLTESGLGGAGLTPPKKAFLRGRAPAGVAGRFHPHAPAEPDGDAGRDRPSRLRGV